MYQTDKEKMKEAFRMGVKKSRGAALGAGAKAGLKLGRKIIESTKNGKALSKENRKTMMPYYKNLKELVK